MNTTHEPNRAEVLASVDHTFLKAEATEADFQTFLQEAVELGVPRVCIPPTALRFAKNLPLSLVAVAGFPSGAHQADVKATEAVHAVEDGASEVDMVANLGLIRSAQWTALQREILLVRRAVPSPIVLKVILETALLSEDETTRATRAASAAGADFVKTSTGMHAAGGASLRAVELMMAAGEGAVQVKASGGIRTFEDAQAYLRMGAARLGVSATRSILDTPGEIPPSRSGY